MARRTATGTSTRKRTGSTISPMNQLKRVFGRTEMIYPPRHDNRFLNKRRGRKPGRQTARKG